MQRVPKAVTDSHQAYWNDGYCVIEGLVDAKVVDQMWADVHGVFETQMRRCGLAAGDRLDDAGFLDRLKTFLRTDRQGFISSARQVQHLISIHGVAVSEALVAAVRGLGVDDPAIAGRPVFAIMSDALRIEEGYNQRPAHQDWHFMQGSLDGVVAWLPFCDVGAGRYPLEVLPGSHLLGPLGWVPHECGTRIVDERLDESGFQPLLMKKGDVAFFSSFMVHRTGAGDPDAMRPMISFRYNNLSEPTFVARQFPDPIVFKPDRTPLFADFPRADQIESCYRRA